MLGFVEILALKSKLNLGLTTELENILNKYQAESGCSISLEREIIKVTEKLNPYWIAGFVSGDGSFSVHVGKDDRIKTGFRVDPRFSVGLHSRDANLIENLANFFNCGVIFSPKDRPVIHFTVGKLSDITKVILSFFDNYPVQGIKILDFSDFKPWTPLGGPRYVE
jgi:hypothetical protein